MPAPLIALLFRPTVTAASRAAAIRAGQSASGRTVLKPNFNRLVKELAADAGIRKLFLLHVGVIAQALERRVKQLAPVRTGKLVDRLTVRVRALPGKPFFRYRLFVVAPYVKYFRPVNAITRFVERATREAQASSLVAQSLSFNYNDGFFNHRLVARPRFSGFFSP